MFRAREKYEDLKNLIALALVIVLSGGIVFAILYRNIRMAIVTYDIERLKKERRAVYIETEELRIKVAQHSSADRMEKLFREKHGFLPVEVSQKISTYILPRIDTTK
ncbi:MAG: Cell division protein FtsL [Turneriella sp.]|nr:Cell division protein FtsL [Turneriella sp.]